MMNDMMIAAVSHAVIDHQQHQLIDAVNVVQERQQEILDDGIARNGGGTTVHCSRALLVERRVVLDGLHRLAQIANKLVGNLMHDSHNQTYCVWKEQESAVSEGLYLKVWRHDTQVNRVGTVLALDLPAISVGHDIRHGKDVDVGVGAHERQNARVGIGQHLEVADRFDTITHDLDGIHNLAPDTHEY